MCIGKHTLASSERRFAVRKCKEEIVVRIVDIILAFDTIVEEARFPDRSPLHPDALNFDDLKRGLLLQKINVYGRMKPIEGLMVDEPFVHRSEPLYDGAAPIDNWMITVATKDYRGKLVLENWYLADMGVVPYEFPDGTPFRWNEQNYTVAVK